MCYRFHFTCPSTSAPKADHIIRASFMKNSRISLKLKKTEEIVARPIFIASKSTQGKQMRIFSTVALKQQGKLKQAPLERKRGRVFVTK